MSTKAMPCLPRMLMLGGLLSLPLWASAATGCLKPNDDHFVRDPVTNILTNIPIPLPNCPPPGMEPNGNTSISTPRKPGRYASGKQTISAP